MEAGWTRRTTADRGTVLGPGPAEGAERSAVLGERTRLLDGVRQWLAESGAEPTPARVAQALREQGGCSAMRKCWERPGSCARNWSAAALWSRCSPIPP